MPFTWDVVGIGLGEKLTGQQGLSVSFAISTSCPALREVYLPAVGPSLTAVRSVLKFEYLHGSSSARLNPARS